MGKIEVEGYAERTVDYDLMVITIGFHEFEKVSDDASKKVMEDCEKYLDALKKAGIDISEIRLKEDSICADTRYLRNYDKEGFTAVRRLEMTTGFDMKMINVLRSIANKNKLPASFDVAYKLSNTSEIQEELCVEALKNAKLQADLVARTIDMKVKGLISANKHTPRDRNSLAMDCLADEDSYDCDELYECEKAFECSDELKSTTKTLSETIYTEWEVIADE